jgi:hypothetical protein
LVGTYGSEIYELSSKYNSYKLFNTLRDSKVTSGTKYTARELVKGHYTPNQKWTNEVWGLCVFKQDNDKWATCSDDGTLRIWSVSKRCQLKSFRLDTGINKKYLE